MRTIVIGLITALGFFAAFFASQQFVNPREAIWANLAIASVAALAIAFGASKLKK